MRYYLTVEKETAEGIVTERVALTSKQAWSAYNAAQAQEIRLFDELLQDLVSVIPEPEREGAGRPPLPLRDQLFCAIQKVYSQLSSRRAKSLFDNAADRGQISKPPHFNASTKLLNREDVTAILHELVNRTALPLAELERDFAVDSTGFRTSTFGAYCTEKHSVKRRNIWLKAHFMSGVKTNIVTDVIITDAGGADVTQFTPLVKATAAVGFNIEEVSADKAYSSRANHEVVGEVGGQAFIPFKNNTTGKSGGSALWRKAYILFKLQEDEFNEHYHKRSNVESTIGAIKQKFGETLKSRNTTAQVNELLCKTIAYNITVLIHEMFEHGVNVDFQSLANL